MFEKTRNVARRYGAKIGAAALASGAFIAAHAQTSTPLDTLFDAVDLSSVTTKVVAMGVLIIGIAVAFKGIGLSKRGVNKV